MRRPLGAVLAAVVCLVLTGCSVPVNGSVGLTVRGDTVVALVRMCPDVTSDRVTLDYSLNSLPAWLAPGWSFDRAGTVDVTLEDRDAFLQAMGDEDVRISTTASSGLGGSLRLNASDLRALGADEVLAYDWYGDEPLTVTLVDFEALAVDFCDGGG